MTEQAIELDLEQAIWDALKALLAATNLGGDVYDYGKVPGADGNLGDLPSAFALLSVARRFAPSNKVNGTDRTGWRVSVRCTGTTTPNARAVRGWVTQAFETAPGRGKRIEVDGVRSTRITHETTSAVAADDGMFSGLVTYTFAL